MKTNKKNIHGIVLLDKPSGMTSNVALQKVKRLFNAKKAGHTGSLDPLATGLLPICLGQATKISEYLLHSDKKYTTTIKLGETTDTLDSEGEVLETKEIDVSDDQLQDALAQFRGEIKQVPPMYSALKKDGQPLYKLARKGEVIDRPARDMTVHSLEANRFDQFHVQLTVHCSSGFYIRSLTGDLGQVLGCGAHVVELRRTAIKSIGLDQTFSLSELEKLPNQNDAILEIDSLIKELPELIINGEQAQDLLHGKLTMAVNNQSTPLSRLYTDNGKLFGIGRVNDDYQLKTDKIFITDD